MASESVPTLSATPKWDGLEPLPAQSFRCCARWHHGCADGLAKRPPCWRKFDVSRSRCAMRDAASVLLEVFAAASLRQMPGEQVLLSAPAVHVVTPRG